MLMIEKYVWYVFLWLGYNCILVDFFGLENKVFIWIISLVLWVLLYIWGLYVILISVFLVFVGVSFLDVGVIVNFMLELGVKNVLNVRVCLEERKNN